MLNIEDGAALATPGAALAPFMRNLQESSMGGQMRKSGQWPGYALCLCSVWLAACGGGGGGGGTESGPPLAGNYFPAGPGDTWSYNGEARLEVVSVMGPVQVRGQSAMRLLTTDANGSALYSYFYRIATDGVWSVALESESATAKALYTYQLLKLPLRVGDVWTEPDTTTPNSSIDFDEDGIGDKMENRIAATVLSVESVTTPVGRFDNCARVQQIENRRFTMSSTGRTADGRIVTDRWFAPGIGLVHTTMQVTYEGRTTRFQDSLLQAYRVGPLHSQGAPSISSTAPAAPLQPRLTAR